MTPESWRRANDWKHGPRRVVLSGERPDPLQLPETAGEQPPSARRPRLSHDLALIVGCAVFLAGLYILADWLVRL